MSSIMRSLIEGQSEKWVPRVPRWTLQTGRCYILQLLETKQHKGSLLICLLGWFLELSCQTSSICAFFSEYTRCRQHVQACVCLWVCADKCVLVCNWHLFFLCCSDMNNRSIAWWLRQIGLSQYTKTLESEYYGLEVCEYVKCSPLFWSLF